MYINKYMYISSTVVNRPLQIWVLPNVLRRLLYAEQAREAQRALPCPNATLCPLPESRQLEADGALPQPPTKGVIVNGRD